MTERIAKELPLPATAARLGLNWRQAFDAVLSHRLEGRQLDNGRWVVSVESIGAYERKVAEIRAGATRRHEAADSLSARRAS
jgi:hypothetical protein